jgi:hypothetical protein
MHIIIHGRIRWPTEFHRHSRSGTVDGGLTDKASSAHAASIFSNSRCCAGRSLEKWSNRLCDMPIPYFHAGRCTLAWQSMYGALVEYQPRKSIPLADRGTLRHVRDRSTSPSSREKAPWAWRKRQRGQWPCNITCTPYRTEYCTVPTVRRRIVPYMPAHLQIYHTALQYSVEGGRRRKEEEAEGGEGGGLALLLAYSGLLFHMCAVNSSSRVVSLIHYPHLC